MPNRFVKKMSRLAQLSTDDVATLTIATANPSNFGPREDIIREGDEPGPLLVIIEGWACRYKILPNGSRQIMAFMMPGDACDLHVSLLAEMDHGIQAVTAVTVASIARPDVQRIMDAHPSISRAMYTAQLIDAGIMRAWIVSMGRRSAVQRVAHLICELYLRARNIGLTAGDRFLLPLSQIVLADALGTTPVHINRVLKQLRLAGAMTLQRGSLTIEDPVKLIKIAGFDENYLHRRLRNVM